MSEALDTHGAVRPKQDNQIFYAVMSWKGFWTMRGKSKALPVILAYPCKEGREIVVSKYVKTFIYMCDATMTWDIHEISTGVKIATGGSITDAYNKCVAFFKEYAGNEEKFFDQMRVIGRHENHSQTTYAQAMEYLTQGEKDNPEAARVRRLLEIKKG